MNKVVHFEIPADNVERAKGFYSKVFGWKTEDVEMAEGKYTMVHTVEVDENKMPKEAGAINGGIMKKEKDDDTPVIVIDVPHLKDHLKEVEKAGGETVMAPWQVSDMGWYARFKDPEGNVIGLWQDAKKK